MNNLARDRVIAARIQTLQSSPFYGLAAMRFELVEDESHSDMWTDGKTLGYSPKWAIDVSFDLLKGTIAHCAHHVALCHHLRREGRNEKNWNRACDVVVNSAMDEAGFALPKGVKVNKADAEKAAEEIYGGYIDPPNNPHGGGKGNKEGDDPSKSDQPGECKDQENADGSSLSESQVEQAIQEQMQDTAALAQQAKGIGDLPAGIARQINKLLYPQQDWSEQLRDFMLNLAKSDYSWSRPNRRFIHQGLYLPSLHSETDMGKIVIAVDTSGSINKRKLSQFCSEINGIFEQVNPESVTVIYCDMRIKSVAEFSRDEYPIEFECAGGGGTDLRPPFQYVADNDINPDVFLYFTDLGGTTPETAPHYPVVWIDQNDSGESFLSQYGLMPSFGRMIGIPS
jgi:predicted metal-dependent peptidase